MFIYLSLFDTNDTVTDFVSGVGKIDLSALDANPGIINDQAFAWAGDLGGQFVQANAVSWHASGGNVDIYADTDGNVATAEFHITLSGIASVLQSDFVL